MAAFFVTRLQLLWHRLLRRTLVLSESYSSWLILAYCINKMPWSAADLPC